MFHRTILAKVMRVKVPFGGRMSIGGCSGTYRCSKAAVLASRLVYDPVTLSCPAAAVGRKREYTRFIAQSGHNTG